MSKDDRIGHRLKAEKITAGYGNFLCQSYKTRLLPDRVFESLRDSIKGSGTTDPFVWDGLILRNGEKEGNRLVSFK